MGRVVDKMRAELRAVMGDSVRDYPAKPREKWMFDWPSQVALVSAGGGILLVSRGQRGMEDGESTRHIGVV